MLVGISGKLGSGKDTFADFIIKHNPSFTKKSFAAKLKQIGAFLTGTPENLWFTQEGKNIFLQDWGMTIGQFQQKLGTEAVRKGLHENAWILSLFADYTEGADDWIITDMRFENEAEAIRSKGGLLIRLQGDPAKIRENSTRDLNHPSETSLDYYPYFDVIVDNIGTLKWLEDYAHDIAVKPESYKIQ